jgi:hypothetical protein
MDALGIWMALDILVIIIFGDTRVVCKTLQLVRVAYDVLAGVVLRHVLLDEGTRQFREEVDQALASFQHSCCSALQ